MDKEKRNWPPLSSIGEALGVMLKVQLLAGCLVLAMIMGIIGLAIYFIFF